MAVAGFVRALPPSRGRLRFPAESVSLKIALFLPRNSPPKIFLLFPACETTPLSRLASLTTPAPWSRSHDEIRSLVLHPWSVELYELQIRIHTANAVLERRGGEKKTEKKKKKEEKKIVLLSRASSLPSLCPQLDKLSGGGGGKRRWIIDRYGNTTLCVWIHNAYLVAQRDVEPCRSLDSILDGNVSNARSDGSDPVKGCENVRSVRNDPSRLPCLAINRLNDSFGWFFDGSKNHSIEWHDWVIFFSENILNNPSRNDYESRLYRTICELKIRISRSRKRWWIKSWVIFSPRYIGLHRRHIFILDPYKQIIFIAFMAKSSRLISPHFFPPRWKIDILPFFPPPSNSSSLSRATFFSFFSFFFLTE